jgi:hypothetical protein
LHGAARLVFTSSVRKVTPAQWLMHEINSVVETAAHLIVTATSEVKDMTNSHHLFICCLSPTSPFLFRSSSRWVVEVSVDKEEVQVRSEE